MAGVVGAAAAWELLAATVVILVLVVVFLIIVLFLLFLLVVVLWWCCCCPLNKVEIELEAAPYSEEVGDTLAEELETGDEQPFTGTSLAPDADEDDWPVQK